MTKYNKSENITRKIPISQKQKLMQLVTISHVKQQMTEKIYKYCHKFVKQPKKKKETFKIAKVKVEKLAQISQLKCMI